MAALKKKRNWRALQFNCFLTYRDADGAMRKGKGRKMVVDGAELELFPSSVLCAIMHKDLRCLYTWERDFDFPQAMWRIQEDAKANRWYSRRQILAVNELFNRFGRLKGKHRKMLPNFIAAVRSVFFIIDQPQRNPGK